MKHIKKIVITTVLAMLFGSAISYLMEDREPPLRINVTDDGYFIGTQLVSLVQAVEAMKSYEHRKVHICREYSVSNSELEALTNKVKNIEYKSKGFTNSNACI
jgi:hypothetical protein